MCNIRDRWQENICMLIGTIIAEYTTLYYSQDFYGNKEETFGWKKYKK